MFPVEQGTKNPSGWLERTLAGLDGIARRGGRPSRPGHLSTGIEGEDAALFFLRLRPGKDRLVYAPTRHRKIVQDTIALPSGALHVSHSPAKANRPSSAIPMWYACLFDPDFFHS